MHLLLIDCYKKSFQAHSLDSYADNILWLFDTNQKTNNFPIPSNGWTDGALCGDDIECKSKECSKFLISETLEFEQLCVPEAIQEVNADCFADAFASRDIVDRLLFTITKSDIDKFVDLINGKIGAFTSKQGFLDGICDDLHALFDILNFPFGKLVSCIPKVISFIGLSLGGAFIGGVGTPSFLAYDGTLDQNGNPVTSCGLSVCGSVGFDFGPLAFFILGAGFPMDKADELAGLSYGADVAFAAGIRVPLVVAFLAESPTVTIQTGVGSSVPSGSISGCYTLMT
jgi:hypothetical protein